MNDLSLIIACSMAGLIASFVLVLIISNVLQRLFPLTPQLLPATRRATQVEPGRKKRPARR